MTPAIPLALAAGLAPVLPGPARAQMDPETFRDYEVLDETLNRGGDPFSTLHLRESDCVYRTNLGQDLLPGAWIDTETVVDFAALDAENYVTRFFDEGPAQIRVPLREDAPPLTYTITLTDMFGEGRAPFEERYPTAICDDAGCTAERETREALIMIVGPTARADIDKVAPAIAGLAAYCADQDSEGG